MHRNPDETATMQHPAGPLRPPDLPDRWRLVRFLGSGGQGQVWLANDVALDQKVALKLIPRAGRERALQRTRREVRLGRELAHSHLVRIFDLVDTPEHLVVVMEFLPGGTLKDAVDQGPLPVERALEVTEQVLRALACLHDHGIIHRDLKPSNLLVAHDGSVKLADLGLARAVNPEADLTRTGETVGTPHYMSPEQLRGDEPSTASDLYGLGATLYELLTGKTPFSESSGFAVAHRHLTQPIPPLVTLRPDCPRWLAAFVHRLLEKRPEDRWPNAESAARALISRRVSNRRLRRRVLRSVGALGLAAVAVWLGATWTQPQLVSARLVDDHTIAALGADGSELWHRSLNGKIRQVEVADVTGDSDPEVVAAVNYDSESAGYLGCSLEVFSRKHTRIASIDPGSDHMMQRYPTMSRRCLISRFEIADVDGDGLDEILMVPFHSQWYPSAVTVWWGHGDGAVDVLLVNSGFIQDLAVTDLDGDGKREVLAAGVNNQLGYQAIVAVLNPTKKPALSPDVPHFSARGPRFVNYVLLGPTTDFPTLGQSSEKQVTISVDGGKPSAFDRWGNPSGSSSPVTAERSRRFWNELNQLANSLRLRNADRAERVSDFRARNSDLVSEASWDLAATLVIARALATVPDHRLAISELRRAAQAHPKLRDLWLRLGEQLLVTGDRTAGRAALKRSLKSGPGRLPFDADLLLTLDAALNRDEEAWQESVSYWRTSSAERIANLTQALTPLRPFFAGRWDDAALENYEASPQLLAAGVMVSWAHLESGSDPSETIRAAHALEDDPETSLQAQLLESRALLLAGRPADALQPAREALERIEVKARTSYEMFIWLPVAEWVNGTTLEALGRRTEALEHYKKAAKLAPRSWFGQAASSFR